MEAEELQSFVERCGETLGNKPLVYALDYRINGRQFRPKVPEEYEEETKRIRKRFEEIRRCYEESRKLNRLCKRLLRERRNPKTYVADGLRRAEGFLLDYSRSYFNTEGLISIAPRADELAVAEEFLHAKSFYESGFQENETTNFVVEGHKLKEMCDSDFPIPPKSPKREIIKKAAAKVAESLILPMKYFSNRASEIHGESETFFSEIMKLTPPEVVDIILRNQPTSREEVMHPVNYFFRIKDLLGEENYSKLSQNAGRIRKKMRSARTKDDLYYATSLGVWATLPIVFLLA